MPITSPLSAIAHRQAPSPKPNQSPKKVIATHGSVIAAHADPKLPHPA